MANLKSITIQGFKTFPDRVNLEILDGVTAIVGPNGSGKSNIAEAIRWVLGEQNARVMRCERKMEEVIFHGSERRGALGFSEVSITISNEDRAFSHNADEIKLTRRLYRSGESEYFINKNMVRLKDLSSLLMDTGLGPGGYSIIAQGMIDRIMTEKPADRRKVFEEAAGIAKYKSRRDESLRKLALSEQNLLRVSDKIGEIEPQVETLREQSETAKKFLKLRDEARANDINLWLHHIEKIRAGKDAQKYAHSDAVEQLNLSKASLENLYAEIETMEREFVDLTLATENKRAEIAEIKNLQSEAESGLLLCENDIRHIQKQCEDIIKDSEKLEERTKSLKLQQAEYLAKQNQIAATLARENEKLDELLNEIEQLSGQSQGIKSQTDILSAKISKAKAEAAEAALRKTALSARKEEQTARQSVLQTEQERSRETLAKSRTELSETEKSLEALKKQISELDNVLSGYKLRAGNRTDALNALKDESEVNRRKLYDAKSRHSLLSDLEKETISNHAVSLVMKSNLPGICGVLSELIKTDDKTAVAIEIALGSALQNVVVENENSAKSAVALLKERKGGRATFLPLTTIDGSEASDFPLMNGEILGVASRLVETEGKYRGILRNLLGRTVIAKNLDVAIEFSKIAKQRLRIVTLDGQVVAASGAITGGSVSKKVGVLSRRNELERLSAEISAIEVSASASAKALETAERNCKAALYELEVCEVERLELSSSADKLKSETAHREVLLKNIQAAEQLSLEELSAISTRLSEIDVLEADELSKIAKSEEEAARLERELETLAAQHGSLETSEGELSGRQTKHLERIAALKAESDGITRALDELSCREADLSLDGESRAAMLDSFAKREDELSALCRGKKDEIANFAELLDKLNAELDIARAEQRELEQKRVASTRKSKDLTEQNLALSRAAEKLENILNAAQRDEDEYISKLWESYELSVTDAQKLKTPLESVSKAQKRAAELKREISALGHVNISAIEQYKTLEERYNRLTEQRADALESKRELENIISDITGEMREIFSKNFLEISEKFRETFIEIFGGGEAALELDENADILESGVEIKARPPGKKLRSISLLSGGEQSLSAIALYFAIFKVRPAPFCVLDEIDHDLDDVNVGRFAEYLKKLAKFTQYIIVTHRRGTMEMAGTLYGVTAQEPGVSKTISLRLSELEDKPDYGVF